MMSADRVRVTFPRSGWLVLCPPGREVRVRPPDFVVSDTATPVRADDHTVAPLTVQVPRSRLALRTAALDRLIGVALPGDHGIGAVLRGYMIGVAGRVNEFRPGDASRLTSVTLELLTATLAHHATTPATTASRDDQRLMRRRIDDYIDHHLADADLCPELIAAEHRISLRYLYKLFEDDKLSVAATIRRRRLEAGRADLAAPAMRARSIQAIATRWGFSDAGRFSHAFRQAYGVTPSDFRKAQA